MPHSVLPVQWRKESQQWRQLSAELRAWLLHRESLTVRLRQHCNNFAVKVLQKNWQQPSYDEKKILNLTPRENIFVREVVLICDDQVCIFAHSIFPKKTLRGKGCRLRSLQAKPLIEILTDDVLLTRSEFEIATLRPGNPTYQRAAQVAKICPEILWQRRSVFYFYGEPLLICETFLPAVLALKKQN